MRRLALCSLLLAACGSSAALRAEAISPSTYRYVEGRAFVELVLQVRAEGDAPLSARRIEYEVRLDGLPVALGSQALDATLPPGETAEVELPLAIGWEQLPPGPARSIERGAPVPVEVRGVVSYRSEGGQEQRAPFRVEGTLRATRTSPAAWGDDPLDFP